VQHLADTEHTCCGARFLLEAQRLVADPCGRIDATQPEAPAEKAHRRPGQIGVRAEAADVALHSDAKSLGRIEMELGTEDGVDARRGRPLIDRDNRAQWAGGDQQGLALARRLDG
jgi:hypothetical protein